MKRALLTVLALSITANVVWLAFMMHDLNTNNIKTTAVVTAIDPCLGYHCPEFTYVDATGKSHSTVVYWDGFNGVNSSILGVKVGDKRTLWYSKSNADKFFVVYGFSNYSVFVLPLIIGLIVCAMIFVVKFVGNKKDKWPAGVVS